MDTFFYPSTIAVHMLNDAISGSYYDKQMLCHLADQSKGIRLRKN